MAEALSLIPDRSLVYVPSLMGPPTALLEAMAAEPDRWTDLETAADYLIEPLPTFANAGAPFRHCSVQPSRALALVAEAGVLRTVSGTSSLFTSFFRPGGPLAVDVVVVQVRGPGPDGRFSLGTNGGTVAELVRTAPLVIAEINQAVPYTRGATECDRWDFDALVEVERHPLIELPTAPQTGVTERIGQAVASIVEDGATVEYGIGAIPDAALGALSGHRELGLHSGMLGDAVIDLVERGVMNGARKSLDRGLLVASAIVGSAAVADWVDGRDDVVVVASGYSHGVPVLARQARFTAINSAIEVGLDGAVNAEVAGDRVVSGPGGQPDFAAGAALAPGGRNIVALPATAQRGTRSRIVSGIDPGARVTVAHHLADHVVTEYGIADVRGVDAVDRAARLRAVAAPTLAVGGGDPAE
ncbi:MAG: acetyl-CoA hydrolase/transferase C-terminal domain-containing protein [Actinomycetota bacterium]